MLVLFSCQNKVNYEIDRLKGKVVLRIMSNTKFEKEIVFSKIFVVNRVDYSPNFTSIYLNDRFCKEINNRNLGALSFELLFLDSKNEIEIAFSSFSKISSFRPLKKYKHVIIFDENYNSFFPKNVIRISNHF